MDIDPLFLIYGWFAYLSAAATILTFVTGILLFSLGPSFGKINDVSSVFQVLLMIPLAILFLQVLPSSVLVLGLATFVGVSGMLLTVYGQSLLVFGCIDFQGSLKYFPAGAAIGMWLILVNSLALGNGPLPQMLAWIGMSAGAGYILTVIGFLWRGQENVLFYIGGFVLGIGYPVWAIWLGRLLLAGAVGKGAG